MIFPLIITGAPANRSGIGNGYTSAPAFEGTPSAMSVRMGILHSCRSWDMSFVTVSARYAAPFSPRPMFASILRK